MFPFPGRGDDDRANSWANAVRFKQQLEFHKIVAKHIDRRRFFGWFVGLALPFTIAMSLSIQWHNGFVGEIQPIHLLLRFGLGIVGYSFVLGVVYRTAVRPALKKAQEEVERRPTPHAR